MLVANPEELLMGVESKGANIGVNVLQISKTIYLRRGEMELINLIDITELVRDYVL